MPSAAASVSSPSASRHSAPPLPPSTEVDSRRAMPTTSSGVSASESSAVTRAKRARRRAPASPAITAERSPTSLDTAPASAASAAACWGVHCRGCVSPTQRVPSTWPSAERMGWPAHATMPSVRIAPVPRARASRRASGSSRGSPLPTTSRQNDLSTGCPRAMARPGSRPTELFQKVRRSSTRLTKASGASSRDAAWAARPSNGSSGAVSSSCVARTAATRSGSRTESTPGSLARAGGSAKAQRAPGRVRRRRPRSAGRAAARSAGGR